MHAAEEVSNLFREHCKALLKDIEDLEGDGTVIQFLPHEQSPGLHPPERMRVHPKSACAHRK